MRLWTSRADLVLNSEAPFVSVAHSAATRDGSSARTSCRLLRTRVADSSERWGPYRFVPRARLAFRWVFAQLSPRVGLGLAHPGSELFTACGTSARGLFFVGYGSLPRFLYVSSAQGLTNPVTVRWPRSVQRPGGLTRLRFYFSGRLTRLRFFAIRVLRQLSSRAC